MEPQLDAPLESAYTEYATKGEDSMNGVKLSGKRTEKGRERYATLFCPFLCTKKVVKRLTSLQLCWKRCLVVRKRVSISNDAKTFKLLFNPEKGSMNKIKGRNMNEFTKK